MYPEDYPHFKDYMDTYGVGIKSTIKTLAGMLDSGLGTDKFF